MAKIEYDYAGTNLQFASKAKLDEWCDFHSLIFAGVSSVEGTLQNPANDVSSYFRLVKELGSFEKARTSFHYALPPIQDEKAGRYLFALNQRERALFTFLMTGWDRFGRQVHDLQRLEGANAYKASIFTQARLGLLSADALHLENVVTEAKAAISELEDTRRSFNEHMNVAAAVTYWESKQSLHAAGEERYLKWTVRSAIGFLLLAIFVPVLIITNGVDWITSRLAGAGDFHTAAFYLIIGLYVLLLTTGLWGLRVLVKLYLSEHHLHADALERLTMTKTYLALHREGTVQDPDRAIVLSSLFRPSSDGVVKDEGLDPSIPHLLSRALAKQP